MAKNDTFLYYVEGEDDEKIVNALKNNYIISGKVLPFNIVQKKITNMYLRIFKEKTILILVFDVDTNNINIFTENLKILKECKNIKKIILVPQVQNLEDELKRATTIKQIKELTNSKSNSDFKRDLLKITNIIQILKKNNFDINKFWSNEPTNNFKRFKNESLKIKIK